MNEAQILDIARDALKTMLVVSGPVLLVGLVIGIVIQIFQTLTSLQEATLTFVPKLLVVFASLILLMPYMLHQMQEFFHRMMDFIIGL